MITKYLLTFIAAFILLMSCDLVWLGLIARSFYFEQLHTIARVKDNFFDINIVAALASWAFLALGIVIFALTPNDPAVSAVRGSLLGFVIYGVYHMSNISFINWPWLLSGVDLAWGTILLGLVSYLVCLLVRLF